jgi:hypothetical protein
MGGKATCAFICCQFNAAIPSVTIAIMDGPPQEEDAREGDEHPSKNLDFLFRAFSGIPVHNRDVDYVQVGQFSFGLYVAEFKAPQLPFAAWRARQDARSFERPIVGPKETGTRSRRVAIPGLWLPNRLRDPEE